MRGQSNAVSRFLPFVLANVCMLRLARSPAALSVVRPLAGTALDSFQPKPQKKRLGSLDTKAVLYLRKTATIAAVVARRVAGVKGVPIMLPPFLTWRNTC